MEEYQGYQPIDAVYTWVNGSDPVWGHDKEFWYQEYYTDIHGGDFNATEYLHHRNAFFNDIGANRFRDHGELRYSLRSIEQYAPWIRHVYIVTADQVPSWLAEECPFVTVVPHATIFPTMSHLPTFNSAAIEMNLDRIPGLSEMFIYFHDDVLLGRPIFPSDFISRTGVQKVYLTTALKTPPKGCPAHHENRNNLCDHKKCHDDMAACGCRDSTYEV